MYLIYVNGKDKSVSVFNTKGRLDIFTRVYHSLLAALICLTLNEVEYQVLQNFIVSGRIEE